jgi:hypothetical protein
VLIPCLGRTPAGSDRQCPHWAGQSLNCAHSPFCCLLSPLQSCLSSSTLYQRPWQQRHTPEHGKQHTFQCTYHPFMTHAQHITAHHSTSQHHSTHP